MREERRGKEGLLWEKTMLWEWKQAETSRKNEKWGSEKKKEEERKKKEEERRSERERKRMKKGDAVIRKIHKK